MSTTHDVLRRCTLSLRTLLLAGLCVGRASAQPVVVATAPDDTAGEPVAGAYQDKVMDDTPLPSHDPLELDAVPEDLRTVTVESRVTSSQVSDGLQLRASTELGQRVSVRQQSVNYGEFVLEADVRLRISGPGLNAGPFGGADARSGERITVRSIDLPLSTTVFATTAAGDIASQVTDALTRTYRVSLGSSAIRGVSVQLRDAGTDVRVGSGARGYLLGGPFPGYQRAQGQLSWMGLSRQLTEDLSAGVQFMEGSQLLPLFSSTGSASGATSVSSVAAAVNTRWSVGDQGRLRARLIGIQSDARNETIYGGTAQGTFAEFSLALPRQRHEFGVFTSVPGLRFGDTLLTLADRGAYWRMDQTGRELSWGLGVDADHQPASALLNGALRVNGSMNVSWRLGRDDLLGATASVGRNVLRPAITADGGWLSTSRNTVTSASWQTRLQPGWGRSTLRWLARRNLQLVSDGPAATGDELLWEQEWLPPTGAEFLQEQFITTLGVARDRSLVDEVRSPTAGLQVRLYPGSGWTVGASLRYTSRQGNLSTSRGLSGTADLEHLLQPGLKLGAALSLNQALVNLPANGVFPAQLSRSHARLASVYLRWEETTGARQEGLGAQPGRTGAGSIDGLVFLDANRDGARQIDESGAAGVEVVLDGRYATRTDANGRFQFPLVATGVHRLTVTPESVPLPWGPGLDPTVTVDVPLRGLTTAILPVVQVGQ